MGRSTRSVALCAAALQGGGHYQACKERVRAGRAGAVLGVCLSCHVVGVNLCGQLHVLNQREESGEVPEITRPASSSCSRYSLFTS